MLKTLRWGILGTGNIARQFCAHLPSARRSTLVAVGSRSLDSATAFAKQYRVPTAYGSYDELLRDPSVDAVYVSLPNTMHHEWTLRALAAGKHVLCEKPFAANAGEAEAMFAAARKAGRVLVEAFMYRAHPVTLAVMDQLRSGAIGQVRLVRSSFCYRTTKIADNIRFDAALAGGALMDIGCYCISLALLVAGGEEPTHVHALGQLHPRGVDEVTIGQLRFPSGLVASFTCGMSVQADNTAYLCGTEGYVEIPVPWKPPAKNALYTLARSIPPRQDQPAGTTGTTVPAVPPRQTFSVDAAAELYAMEADAFAATVLDGAPPFMSERDTLATMRILDEMRRQVGVRM